MNHRRPKSTGPFDSDEDDEEPRNEPATSSNSQPTPCNPGDEDSEYSDEYCAQSWDSERTLFYSELYVLTNDEHLDNDT